MQQSGLYTLKLAAIVKPGDKPMLRLRINGRELPGPICLTPAENGSGSLRYVAENIPLEAGRHSLQFTAERCRALNGEMQLELAAPDRLRIRPSLQRGGLLPEKPLVAQVGLLGIDGRCSCSYALTISLYSEDDHLLDEATVTGIVPRSGEEVQRVCLAGSRPRNESPGFSGQAMSSSEAFDHGDSLNGDEVGNCHAASRYKLKLAVTYDGITRTHCSNWIL